MLPSTSTTEVTPRLMPLVERLSSLTDRAPKALLHEWLAELDVTADDLAPWIHFGRTRYLRNRVFQCEMAQLLVICWGPGQRSPIHNHEHSTCGFKVVGGTCTETVFRLLRGNHVVPVSSVDYPQGSIICSQDADIHQVSNLEPRGGPGLITLHIYSPPLDTMDTYSLTDSRVRRYTPSYWENVYGDGI